MQKINVIIMVGEGQLTKKNIINNKVFYSGLSYDI